MKKIFKSLLLILVLMVGVFTLTGCVKKETSKEEKPTGEGSTNIPLKDNYSEAEYQIKIALQKQFEEDFGDEVVDMRIYVKKVYTAEDEKEVPALVEKKLGENEVAFEVSYELKLADGVDPNKYLAATGKLDEETGWITEKYNVGIIKYENNEYTISNFGTAF